MLYTIQFVKLVLLVVHFTVFIGITILLRAFYPLRQIDIAWSSPSKLSASVTIYSA